MTSPLYQSCSGVRKVQEYPFFPALEQKQLNILWGKKYMPVAELRIRIRIGSGFNRVSGSGSGFGIRIRIREGKNDPQKWKKFVKVHVLKCWMASFES